MCMIVDEAVTKEVLARLKRGGGKARFWKLYRSYTNGLGSFGLGSLFWKSSARIQKPGEYSSDRKTGNIGGRTTISKGFHVFLTRDEARRWKSRTDTLVSVFCREDNLVAGGKQGHTSLRAAVFTHIEITEADFAKATGASK